MYPLTWKEIAAYTGIFLSSPHFAMDSTIFTERGRRKGERLLKQSPRKSLAHVRAMIRLRELQEKRIWQQGDVKLFYSEATEIVRQYFEGRYGIMALELTSYEVFDRLKRFQLEAGNDQAHRNSLHQCRSGQVCQVHPGSLGKRGRDTSGTGYSRTDEAKGGGARECLTSRSRAKVTYSCC